MMTTEETVLCLSVIIHAQCFSRVSSHRLDTAAPAVMAYKSYSSRSNTLRQNNLHAIVLGVPNKKKVQGEMRT